MQKEEIIKKLQSLKGENFARVIPKDAKHFPYLACIIQKGYEDENEELVDTDRFYVICGNSSLPPDIVHYGGFATAEAVLDGCFILSRPLKDWVDYIIVGGEFTV